MEVGRKIYYEVVTGNSILDTGEKLGDVIKTTQEQDFQFYIALQPYQQSAVGIIQCDFGYESDNFSKYPFHINITKTVIDQTAVVWDTANPLGATLSDVQQAKISQINDLYNKKLLEGFTSTINNIIYSFGYAQTDRDKFVQLALKVILKGAIAFPVTVHPKDGSSVSLDQTQYTQLVDDIAAFAEPLDAKQHDYIVQTNNATTTDQINAIVVAF